MYLGIKLKIILPTFIRVSAFITKMIRNSFYFYHAPAVRVEYGKSSCPPEILWDRR